jgi:hypothetical protein
MKTRDQRVSCTIHGCSRILSGYRGLKAHLKAHQNTKIPKRIPPANELYICETCNKKYKVREHLHRHIKTQHVPGEGRGVIEIFV